ncbi:MAG: hypothetical protein KIT73_19075, partial [Burkholderiales bacterium]|nr:hypothetical protein [Burkholderiales bacterium]
GIPGALRMGDSVSTAGAWGQASRFGGLRLTSNRPALQAGQIRTSSLTAADRWPSDPAASSDGYGDPSLFAWPLVHGLSDIYAPAAGAASTGVAQVATTTMMAAPPAFNPMPYVPATMLAPGSRDYTVDVGFVREQYGLMNAKYGVPIAVADIRQGFWNRVTGAGRFESSGETRVAGMGLDVRIADWATVRTHAATSRSIYGEGTLGMAGIERHEPLYNVSLRAHWATEGFHQAGLGIAQRSARERIIASGGINLAPYGSINASFTRQTLRDMVPATVTSANYTRPFGPGAFISLNVSYVTGPLTDARFVASFGFPLGRPIPTIAPAGAADTKRAYGAGYADRDGADGAVLGPALVGQL